jgi:phosphatidylserine decarboxylase
LQLTLAQNAGSITLVPVAAILVASMKFHAIEQSLNLNYNGPNNLTCDAIYHKGDEMGYFEHGSTILLFATDNYAFADGIEQGMTIKMGQSLLIDQSVSA